MSVQNRIHRRIKGKGRGSVFVPKDFLDLGSRSAVDKALSRLVEGGILTRLRRGMYYFPKEHPRLGVLTPLADDVARALVGDAPLQPSGAAAAHIVGLSTQVPARAIYYSDRTVEDVRIGNRVISIREGSPRQLAGADRPSGVVIQALKHLGADGVDDRVVNHLRRTLPADVKRDLARYVRNNPRDVADWMRAPVRRITEGAG